MFIIISTNIIIINYKQNKILGNLTVAEYSICVGQILLHFVLAFEMAVVVVYVFDHNTIIIVLFCIFYQSPCPHYCFTIEIKFCLSPNSTSSINNQWVLNCYAFFQNLGFCTLIVKCPFGVCITFGGIHVVGKPSYPFASDC